MQRTLSPEDWQTAIATLRQHPLLGLLHQDPYSHRGYAKPRGYAGDAVLLDYLYHAQVPAGTTPAGAGVFGQTVTSSGGLAVVWRARYLGGQLDAVAARHPGKAQVLSLACGHLREANFSRALADGGVAALHAWDQDAESLAVVQKDYGHLSVQSALVVVKALLKGERSLSGLHLAYAAGLYDYLPDPVAVALTARLFAMLAPGGKLIVPNFLPSQPARGYMESAMDWHLIYRTSEQIQSLAAALPAAQVASQGYFEDPYGAVGYVEVVKAG